MFHDTGTTLIAFTWIAYSIVFLVVLYKSYEFFKAIENKKEFEDVASVPPLKNLYISLFSLQIIALGLTIIVLSTFSPLKKK